MMPDASTAPVTFQALNLRHVTMLEAQADDRFDPAAARAFIADAAAAGAQIESIADRDSLRAMMNYWSATIARFGDAAIEEQPEPVGAEPDEPASAQSAGVEPAGAEPPPPPPVQPAPHAAPPVSARPILAGFNPSLAPTLAESSNPFVGLASFDETQSAIFFGRDQAARDLLQLVLSARVVIVSGGPGTGKSSLVRAGLAKAAAENADTADWSAVVCVPGNYPVDSILTALAPQDIDATAWIDVARRAVEKDPGAAAMLAAERAGDGSLVMIIDQLDELVSLASREQRERAGAMLAAIMQVPRVHLVVTLRDDYVSGSRSRRSLPGLDLSEAQEFRVPPLDPVSVRTAIVEPAAQVGLVFQDGLVDRLVAEVGSDPAMLPQLQYTLLRLWKRRQGNRITAQVYDEVGGPASALGNAAQEVFDSLPGDQDRANARTLFQRLVRTSLGFEFTRDRVTRAELDQLLPGQDVDALLKPFVNADLIRITRGAERTDDRVEIIHDALIRGWEPLRRWATEICERETSILELDAQAMRWSESRGAFGHLLFGKALRDGERTYDSYRNQPRVDRLRVGRVGRFLGASRRMQRRLLTGVALIATFLLAMVTTVLILRLSNLDKSNLIASQERNTDLALRTSAALEGPAYASAREDEAARQFIQMLLSRGTIDRRELPPGFADMTPLAQPWGVRDAGPAFDPAFLGARVSILPQLGRQQATRLDLPNTRAFYDPASGLPLLIMTQTDRRAARVPGRSNALYRLPGLAGQPDEAALARNGLALARLVRPGEIAWGNVDRTVAGTANLLPLMVPVRQGGDSGRDFAAWPSLGVWLRLNHNSAADRLFYFSGAVPAAGATPGTPPRQLWKIAVSVDQSGQIVADAAMLPSAAASGDLPGRTSVAAIQTATGIDFSALIAAIDSDAAPTASAPAAAAGTPTATIYMQVPNLDPIQTLTIRDALVAANFDTPPAQLRAPCVTTPHVRYYYPEDAPAAARAAGVLGAAVRNSGLGDRTIAVRQLDAKAFPNARRGVIEFWICGPETAPGKKGPRP